MIGNPTSDKGNGEHTVEQVHALLVQAGKDHGFDVINLTGTTYQESFRQAVSRWEDYDHLVVVGGDGMVALGVNVVRASGKSLGIVAIGSGNDFSRGLGLPINRVRVAVEGIVAAIVLRSHLDVDLGILTRGNLTQHLAQDADAVHGAMEPEYDAVAGDDGYHAGAIHYFAGMLSCGLDASINDRANHSHLPNGTLRYFVAVLVELSRMRSYGYHVKAELADGSIDERDIISPLLTIANSRHVGGGIELSPYSLFSDGLLDMVWLKKKPNLPQIVHAVSNIYNGRLLDLKILGWQRVASVEITRSVDGARPPVFMADGESVGTLPVRVTAVNSSLRVLVPPAVVEHDSLRTQAYVDRLLIRDGRK